MAKPAGRNRTGISGSAFDDYATPADLLLPSTNSLSKLRTDAAADSEVMGSIPGARTFKGVAKSAFAALRGQRAAVLIDKLGQRAAFERTGTRLYEGLLSKHDAFGSFPGGPMREELEVMRVEELKHFHLCVEAIESIGGDPTAVTPSANRDGVLAGSLIQIVTDPRTRLGDCLEAALTAELVDNDGWTQLIEVAGTLLHISLATAFTKALAQEVDHLKKIRGWVSTYIRNEANARSNEQA